MKPIEKLTMVEARKLAVKLYIIREAIKQVLNGAPLMNYGLQYINPKLRDKFRRILKGEEEEDQKPIEDNTSKIFTRHQLRILALKYSRLEEVFNRVRNPDLAEELYKEMLLINKKNDQRGPESLINGLECMGVREKDLEYISEIFQENSYEFGLVINDIVYESSDINWNEIGKTLDIGEEFFIGFNLSRDEIDEIRNTVTDKNKQNIYECRWLGLP